MKIEKLIKGQIYTIIVPHKNFWMVGEALNECSVSECDENNLRGQAIYITSQGNYQKNGTWCYKADEDDGNDRIYRLSTPEEVIHFSKCVKKGKYIEGLEVSIESLPTIVQSQYEIY